MNRRKERCTLGFCKEVQSARGLCRPHYERLKRTGDPHPNRKVKICSIEDCWGDVKGRGMCSKHYQRWKLHGDPFYIGRVAPPCSIEGCKEKNWSRGYCQRHYAKWRRHGDPLWKPITQCQMPQCWKPLQAHGLCPKHYFRWRKYGDPFFDGTHGYECQVEGCFEPRRSKGFCNSHYARWREFGDPIYQREGYEQPMGIDLPMAPIEEILSERGGFAGVMDHLGPDYWPEAPARDRVEKYLDRARKERGGWIDLTHADHFAVKILGSHPALIWGEDYYTAEGTHEERKAGEEPEVEHEREGAMAA